MVQPVLQSDRGQLTAGQVEGVDFTGQFQRHSYVFKSSHSRKQMEGLQHDADPPAASFGKLVFIQGPKVHAPHPYLAASGAFEARQHRHQRRLSGSRCSENGDTLSTHDLQVDTAKDLHPRLTRSKGKRDIACPNGNGIRFNWCMHGEDRSLVQCLKHYGMLLFLVHLAGCSGETPTNEVAQPQPGQTAASNSSATMPEADTRLVVAFGDSLYAGYNLDTTEGFAPALERALTKRGVKAKVVNAGVSGETTADGLRRLAFTLDGQPRKPDLVLVGLGGNDMLRGLDPALARDNLDRILAELDRRDIDAMLTGLLASRNMGPDYASKFDSIYPELARKYDIPLYPFFLDTVVGKRELMLADGIHPNAKGIEQIVDHVVPLVAEELKD